MTQPCRPVRSAAAAHPSPSWSASRRTLRPDSRSTGPRSERRDLRRPDSEATKTSAQRDRRAAHGAARVVEAMQSARFFRLRSHEFCELRRDLDGALAKSGQVAERSAGSECGPADRLDRTAAQSPSERRLMVRLKADTTSDGPPEGGQYVRSWRSGRCSPAGAAPEHHRRNGGPQHRDDDEADHDDLERL